MSVSFVDSEHSSNNPLELLVEIVGANDWPHDDRIERVSC